MARYDFARFLNVRNAYSPSPSPDGSRVAFLSDITGVPQVWSVPVEGGWPEQLTFYAERVATVEYSPAGDRVLFGMDAGGNERQGLYSVSPDGAAVEPLAVAEDVIHSWGAWSPDGSQIAYASNTRDRHYFDIYARPLDGEPRRVLQQDGTNNVVGWSPDGRSLLVSRAREMYTDTDLYLLDLASGGARLLTEHEGEAYHGSPHFVGEDTLLLVASRDREFAAPARLDLRTGELRYLVETEWDAEELAASADGRVVAYTLNEEGYSRLRLEVGGEPRTVAGLPDGVIVGLKLSEDGSTLVFAHYGATRNGNVWAVDTASGEAKQVTDATRAGLPDEALAEPPLARDPTLAGRDIPAFL